MVEQPIHAHVQATKRGLEVLTHPPIIINMKFLKTFPTVSSFTSQGETQSVASRVMGSNTSPALLDVSITPEEQISAASETLDEALRDALLARVLDGTPTFFEKLIIDLLLSMGYGGSMADAGRQIGGTGDGGVDGVIREDQLGLDLIYLQAKRYKPGNTIGSEAVHAFMGGLLSRGTQKGVFITTSGFSKAALQVANQPGQLRLVLIDGSELTKLMVRFGVGVRVARQVEIKRVDLDYFEGAEPE